MSRVRALRKAVLASARTKAGYSKDQCARIQERMANYRFLDGYTFES